ncbi:LacI family DNA-binding transcriptional regulator [Glycomyces xiaoerkulensis]|uniref:LacI family DNA-binding transcriptional regulator n=1 Tax=Glycomyces xiaoerkulensis TaxID=2038139 RepID=UPI000C264317|nr:LacI family DNA-binding transcriptional regulator [Glycomyces xiaoerkulensis]
MAATIKDVAREAQVHMSTVSRAFSVPHRVRPETRTRIMEAARRLGYRPSRVARALTTGRTHNIGFIVADIANPFFPPMIKAAEHTARARDYHLFVADASEDPAIEAELVDALAKQVDGVVLCAPRVSNAKIERLNETIPIALVNRKMTGIPSVTMDVVDGSQVAIEHLLELGHRKIAYVSGPRQSWTNSQIRRSVTSTADDRAEVTVLGPNTPNEDAGLAVAEQVASSGITAVLAYNDLLAIGLMEGLHSLGVDVPGQVSVIGIDDTVLARLARPSLTTLIVPTPDAGTAAIDLLLQYAAADMGEEEPRGGAHISLPTKLVVRDSTAPPPD